MIITLLWVGVIFSFSLRPASESSQMSMGFGRWLVETFLPGFLDKLEAMSQEQLDFLHFLLRKTGHFSEYFVLGALSMLTLGQTKLRCRKMTGIGFCVLVASVDETIQLFVSGRSGQVTDVVLDGCGAMAGIVVVAFVLFVSDLRRKKSNLTFQR